MAGSDVEVASQACLLVRANTIDAFDDGSNEADIVGPLYPSFITDIFGRYPWSFAKKKRQLTVDATAPVNEYSRAFTVPADCIRLVAIYNSAQVGARPITRGWKRVGGFIESNETQLWGEYTYYVAENYWPGYFLQYAIHALATLICIPVTDDKDRADDLQVITYGTKDENERGGKFSVAASADAQSQPADEVSAPDLVLARFS